MSFEEPSNTFSYSSPVAEAPAAAPVPATDVMALINQLTPDEQSAALKYAQANALTGTQLLEYLQTSINQQSVNSEATLMQGGYDAGIAMAVSGSVGVGGSEEATQQAAADYARMAAQAIANGQTPDQVRFNDPRLTEEAKADIYAQVAQQQGTSAEEITRKAEEQRQADMAAVQTAIFGGAALFGGASAAAESPALFAPLAMASAQEQNSRSEQPPSLFAPLAVASAFEPSQRAEQSSSLFAPLAVASAQEQNSRAAEFGPLSPPMQVAEASRADYGNFVPANVPDVRTELGITRNNDGWSRGSYA